MTYEEVIQAARGNLKLCHACPVCNGIACKNTIPGPGSKGTGTVAPRNYNAWQEIYLNSARTCSWIILNVLGIS